MYDNYNTVLVSCIVRILDTCLIDLGVRSVSLWSAYFGFDAVTSIFVSVVTTVILLAVNTTWYHLGYVLAVLLLYGLASILLAYLTSLICTSQLAAFAVASGWQA